MASIALSAWSVLVIRLTLFLRESIDGAGLWQQVVNEPPEIDELRPREGARQQVGRVRGATLSMQLNPGRLDWLLTPAFEDGNLPPSSFGKLDEGLALYKELFMPWLGARRDLVATRAAFGLIAVIAAPDADATYAKLADLVPSVRYDRKNASEVFYRVNRPKESRVAPGIELNRLTTWSSARSLTYISAPGVVVPTGTDIVPTPGGHLVRCECDNSTPATASEPLKSELLVPLFEELSDMAAENASKGEIP